MDMKKTGIFAAAILSVLVALVLPSSAGSSIATDTDSQEGTLQRDAQLWMENCSMCHETKPRIRLDPPKLDVIMRHMREEAADLSSEKREAILGFLQSGT